MAIEIIKQQRDETNPDLWHFKIAGPATGGEIRLADLSRETISPADWLAAHQTEAQAAIDAGVVNEEYNQRIDFEDLEADITNQVDWIGGAIPGIDTGLGAVGAFTNASQRAIVTGLLQNQKRELQIIRGILKAFRFIVRKLIG